MNELINIRARVKELLEKKENSDFFKSLYESGSGLTPAQNITAPEDIEELIRELVYEKSKFYKHLDVRRFSGDETVYISKNASRYIYNNPFFTRDFGFKDECFDYEGQGQHNDFENHVGKIHLQSKKIMLTTSICNALLEENSYLEVAIEMINNISTIMAFIIDRNVIFGDKEGLEGAFDFALEMAGLYQVKPEDYNLNYIIETANSFYKIHKRMPIIIMDTKFFMGLKLKTKIKGFVKTGDEQKEIELFEEKNVLDLDGITFNNGDVILPNGIRIIVLNYNRLSRDREIDWRILIVGNLYDYVLGERKGIEFSKDESNSFNLDETSFRVKFRADGREDIDSDSIAYKFDI